MSGMFLYWKLRKIIESCRTYAQFQVARRMINVACRNDYITREDKYRLGNYCWELKKKYRDADLEAYFKGVKDTEDKPEGPSCREISNG